MYKLLKRAFLLFLTAILLMSLTGCQGKTVTVGTNNEKAEVRTTTCTRCKGNKVCSHCNGDGFRDGRRCSSCNGTKNCTACLGKGRLEVLVIDGKDYVYCTMCHGNGRCQGCSGSGKMQYWNGCSICGNTGDCRSCRGNGVTRLTGF